MGGRGASCVGLLKYLRAFDVPGASTALIKALRLVNCSMPTARGVIVDMFSEVYISNKVCSAPARFLQCKPELASCRATCHKILGSRSSTYLSGVEEHFYHRLWWFLPAHGQ